MPKGIPKKPEEKNRKISEALKGHKPWNTGFKGLKRKSMSKETKIKIGLANSISHKGEKNHFWIDGRSKENNPYPEKWIDILKDSIRQRDNYVCQICGIHQDELKDWNRKLDCHHKDYNKDNLNPENLTSLCRSCHIKTNYNREYWKNYFNKLNNY